MINFIKNMTLSLFLLTAGLHAAAEQKSIALQMIEAMQGCITFNQQTQQPLDASGIKQQQSAWQNSVALYHRYINDLRGQSKLTQPTLTQLPVLQAESLIMQSNQSKALFTRLLDEYVANLGNVYEKKSGLLELYRNVYSIASSDDQNLSITPNEYIALVQTLDNAARQGNWGTTINLTLPIVQENKSIIKKNLTLNEITAAIKQVPLPASYYATALKVAAGAAIAGGIYYAYNNPQAFGLLQGKVTDVETKLDTASVVDQAPVEQNVVANPAPVTRITPSFEEFMKKHIDLGNINVNQDQPVEQNWISNVNQDQPVEQNFISEEEIANMTKPRTVQDWQAGGDQENYGLSGYSDLDVQGVTTLLPIGQTVGAAAKLGATAAKSGATAVGTRLGLTGPGAGELAGQGAVKGIENFGKYGSSPVGAIASKTIESSPTTGTLAQARIGAQLDNLPAGYVQPATITTTGVTKNVSPNWAVNFGQ